MKRFYELDADGRIVGSYAVVQPGKTLMLLDWAPNQDSMWNGTEWVPDTEKINARLAEIAELDAEEAAISDSLPDWATIEKAIDEANLAQMKVIIKKGFKVVYNLALWRRKVMAELRGAQQ